MNSRSIVLASAALFALAAASGHWFFPARCLQIFLVLLGLLHLWSVVARHQTMDRLVVIVGYALLASSLFGVLSYVFSVAGPTEEGWLALLSFLEETWTTSGLLELAKYLITALVICTASVIAVSLIGKRELPGLESLVAGVFTASVLLVACDYAYTAPLVNIGVFRHEESVHFLFAAGLSALDFPLIFHLLISATAAAFFAWRRVRQAD